MRKYVQEDLQGFEQMVQTQGWELIRRFADETMESISRSFLAIDPSDSVRIAALQGEIRGIKRVFTHVAMALGDDQSREE